ncbi:putative transporter [Halarchaeum rubridurum]|uniref:Putative transporter n=1 Tax=Halarchaeum rubridurum TaxID=489911 RepID=A0A830FKT7_9EURY|nr:putative transporter [Halarchaeum rubridurum]
MDVLPFVAGASISLLFVAVTALYTETVSTRLTTAYGAVGRGLSWLYLASGFLLVVLAAVLMCSRYGRLTLGEGDPEYSYVSYVAMFFSAGLSAGIVFFGPVEALLHYQTVPPYFADVAGGTEAAMVPALATTFFNYGMTAWGGYLAIGLPVAYYAYNEGAPFRVSTALLPLLGRDNLDGVVGRTVDVLAVVATIGGVATGLGFIATQLLTGVTYGTGVEFGPAATVLVIVGITVVFTVSLLAGVNRGIRRLSDFNLALMALLLAVTFVFGPTLDVLNVGSTALGVYLARFFEMSLFTGATGGAGYVSAWPVFYVSWWIAWAPFVGLFLARISRGRTIREVLFTSLVTMTGVSVTWFTVVGGTSMWLQHAGVAEILDPVGRLGNGVAGYALFGALPLGDLWSALFMVLVVTFFATSADSSTLSVAMLTTGGAENPSALNRLFWGVLQGVVAAILVVLGGASALRSSVIVTGAPFAVICVVAFVCFLRRLGRDADPLVFGPNRTWFRAPDDAGRTAGENGTSGANDD